MTHFYTSLEWDLADLINSSCVDEWAQVAVLRRMKAKVERTPGEYTGL